MWKSQLHALRFGVFPLLFLSCKRVLSLNQGQVLYVAFETRWKGRETRETGAFRRVSVKSGKRRGSVVWLCVVLQVNACGA